MGLTCSTGPQHSRRDGDGVRAGAARSRATATRTAETGRTSPIKSAKSLFGESSGSMVCLDDSTSQYIIPRESLRIGRTIGSGSFGMVAEGWLHGTKVAVKIIDCHSPENVLDQEEAVEAFVKEARMYCSLRHPNIVLAMGIVLQPSLVMIVTEYLERGTLREILTGSKTSYPFVPVRVNWALDAARGMAYLHSLSPPILHRDLKTNNLLIDRGYTLKICDFGLSRFMLAESVMTCVGTVQFAAPEVLRQEAYGSAADVFSMGGILWELFTRTRIFKGVAQVEVYRNVINGQMPAIPDSCPPQYAKCIRGCWQMDPAQRPTFEDLIPVLESVADSNEQSGGFSRLLGFRSANE
ncbi:hypothetical protein CDCA_CDCA12G3460 [Cyanidium caldarium]|uniref:Protein kinase domain-containing protein n=1 Tax=Cyanidium caldarium TaxID=2771 RepID=A0AAV9IZE8_CYACA|nr:hypothetical protein CDCA_CDCA12G3460 [Cyanidium caldarium]